MSEFLKLNDNKYINLLDMQIREIKFKKNEDLFDIDITNEKNITTTIKSIDNKDKELIFNYLINNEYIFIKNNDNNYTVAKFSEIEYIQFLEDYLIKIKLKKIGKNIQFKDKDYFDLIKNKIENC